MNYKSLHLLIALIGMTKFSVAQQTEPDLIDQQLKICMQKVENQTTAGMCNCIYEAERKWDKKLNSTYKALLLKLTPPARKALINAQRSWVNFKENELILLKESYGKEDGTMWRLVLAQEVMELSKQRATNLQQLLNLTNN